MFTVLLLFNETLPAQDDHGPAVLASVLVPIATAFCCPFQVAADFASSVAGHLGELAAGEPQVEGQQARVA